MISHVVMHQSNYFLLLRMQLLLCQAPWKKVLRNHNSTMDITFASI